MRWLLCAAVCATAALARAADPELHAVGLYEGFDAPRDHSKPGTAKIEVDRPNKEVVLVLTAYNSIDWTVTVTPKTKLTRVIVGGYHRQQVTAPRGIEVEDFTSENVKQRISPAALRHVYDLDDVRFRPFVRELFELTKLPLSSFTGAYKPQEATITVSALQKDDRLSTDFPQLSPKAQLPKFAFEGTRFVREGKGFSLRAVHGEFTEAGPSKDAPVLPLCIAQAVDDTVGKVRYGIHSHYLYVVNTEKDTANMVVPVGVEPRSLTALTFDAKRGRVLVTAQSGFYEYVPKTGAWAELQKQKREQEPFAALAWCKATDTLYAVRGERPPGGGALSPVLVELAANGAAVKSTQLGPLVFPGLLHSFSRNEGRAQLIDLGKQLALLVHTNERDGNGKLGKPEAFLYAIDPATGGAKLAWKESAK